MTSKRMYIMPDGRPLGTYLTDTETAKHSASSRRRRRKNGDVADWDQGKRTISEVEQAQIDAAMRAGRSRRRRYFNDKLLRDMAGQEISLGLKSVHQPVCWYLHVAVATALLHIWSEKRLQVCLVLWLQDWNWLMPVLT